MSVNHFFLPVNDSELATILEKPANIYGLVEARENDVRTVDNQGIAIISLIATDKNDPLAFLEYGGPEDECGWVGDYKPGNGGPGVCEVDMGYGPARYFRSSYVITIAEAMAPISASVFASRFNADELEEHNVYPGAWHNEGRRDFLVNRFLTRMALPLGWLEFTSRGRRR